MAMIGDIDHSWDFSIGDLSEFPFVIEGSTRLLVNEKGVSLWLTADVVFLGLSAHGEVELSTTGGIDYALFIGEGVMGNAEILDICAICPTTDY